LKLDKDECFKTQYFSDPKALQLLWFGASRCCEYVVSNDTKAMNARRKRGADMIEISMPKLARLA